MSKKKNSSLLVVVIGALVLIGGAFFLLQGGGPSSKDLTNALVDKLKKPAQEQLERNLRAAARFASPEQIEEAREEAQQKLDAIEITAKITDSEKAGKDRWKVTALVTYTNGDESDESSEDFTMRKTSKGEWVVSGNAGMNSAVLY